MKKAGSATQIAAWARRYIEVFGMALVSIDPGEKAPKGNGWNKPRLHHRCRCGRGVLDEAPVAQYGCGAWPEPGVLAGC